jgi:hypothetical protein
MADSQVLPSPVELVKLQFRGGCSAAAISMITVELVFFGRRGKWARNTRGINYIRAELAFRRTHQE